MRLYPQRYRKRKPRIEIIPMVDVMFLLLVFYILSSLALSAQRGIPVQLPSAGTGQAGPGEEIVVTIDASGQFFLDKEKVDSGNLGTALTALASTRPGGIEAVRQGSIVLSADMGVPHRLVVKAMDQLRSVGIENFAIAIEPK